ASSGLSLHDALPIWRVGRSLRTRLEVSGPMREIGRVGEEPAHLRATPLRIGGHEREKFGICHRTLVQQEGRNRDQRGLVDAAKKDRKSTRLNSSHVK